MAAIFMCLLQLLRLVLLLIACTCTTALEYEIRYITASNNVCLGECPKSNNFCTTIDGSWDYCSNLIPKKIWRGERTHNIYTPCKDECKPDKKWCNTYIKTWEYCYPNETIYTIDNIIDSETRCVTPCMRYNGDTYKCYDIKKNWQTCYLFPDSQLALTKLTKPFNVYGEYTSKGYQICTRCQRSKRGINFFRQNIDVGAIARTYESRYPEEVVRQPDPSIVTTNPDPILSYSMYPIPGAFGTTQVFLPLTVTSLLTHYTLRARPRDSFNDLINNQYDQMQRIPALDERGHIVASRFNGPNEIYNIFPQLRQANRGTLSRWWIMENDIAIFLQNHNTGYIEHTAVLSYDFTDLHRPMRPNAVGLRLRVFDNNHVPCDLQGNPLNNQPNPYENMYYNNDPDYCCLIEGDQSPN